MMIRWIGAGCILIGCGALGLFYSLEYRRAVRMVRQLIIATEHMGRELRYRQLPVPELLLNTGDYCGGYIKILFIFFSKQICAQQHSNIESCMKAALESIKSVPPAVTDLLIQFSKCIGVFDLHGQLECLENVRAECARILDVLTQDQVLKTRSFQTLALCTGAAIAILLI